MAERERGFEISDWESESVLGTLLAGVSEPADTQPLAEHGPVWPPPGVAPLILPSAVWRLQHRSHRGLDLLYSQTLSRPPYPATRTPKHPMLATVPTSPTPPAASRGLSPGRTPISRPSITHHCPHATAPPAMALHYTPPPR